MIGVLVAEDDVVARDDEMSVVAARRWAPMTTSPSFLPSRAGEPGY
jgi:hypothetical protein